MLWFGLKDGKRIRFMGHVPLQHFFLVRMLYYPEHIVTRQQNDRHVHINIHLLMVDR